MSNQVLNYPRKLLTDQERTIRATIARIGSSASATGTVQTVKLTADRSSTSSTLANATDLFLTVSNGVYYQFQFDLLLNSASGAVPVEIGLTIPSKTRFAASIPGWNGAIRSSGDWILASNTTQTASVDYMVPLSGIILPSADGTIQVTFGSADNSTSVTVRQGSSGILITL